MKRVTWFSSLVLASIFAAASAGVSSSFAMGKTQSVANSGSARATKKSDAFPITLVDGAHRKVTIDARPRHIVSVTEGTDELLLSLVPKRDIAMVTTYAADPEYSNVARYVRGIPQIQAANAEQILAAKPDLVLLANYTSPGVVTQIQQTNVPVYELTDFNSIADIEKNITVVGELVGRLKQAVAIRTRMQQQLGEVEHAVAHLHKPTVLDSGSSGSSAYVAGKNTIVNDIIEDAGGINAAAKIGGWADISDEQLVALNPDVIIDYASDKGFVKRLLTDPAFQSVSAVKHHRVYLINSADLGSVSQFVTRGVWDVAKVLHPEAKLPRQFQWKLATK